MALRPVDAEFLGSFPNLDDLPQVDEPQLICIGRSNVGKSTLINRLAGRKSIARTSSTPGRTQAVNLFRIELRDEEDNQTYITLADLPGFGFAKVGKGTRNYFEKLIIAYIDNAQNVSALLLLNDSRRNPGKEELILRDIAFENGHVVYVVLTKVDKLKKNDIKKSVNKVAKAYNLENGDVLLAGEKISISNIYSRIEALSF